MMEISRVPQNNARNWEEDPLEGPSWLFNNTITMPSRDNEPEELDHLRISDVNNNTSQVLYDDSSDAESVEELASLPNLTQFVKNMQRLERNIPLAADRIKYKSYSDHHDADDNFYGPATVSDRVRKCNTENDDEEDCMASFVTIRRGNSKDFKEKTEDFTLMLREVKQNMQFNMNDALPEALPVEECMINSIIDNEVDSSAAMNTPISSVSNVNRSDSRNDEFVMKFPIVLIDNHDKTSERKTHSIEKGKKKTSNLKDKINNAENTVSKIQNKKKQNNLFTIFYEKKFFSFFSRCNKDKATCPLLFLE